MRAMPRLSCAALLVSLTLGSSTPRIAHAAEVIEVKAERVNLYADRDTASRVIATVSTGAVLTILAVETSWYRVAAPGSGFGVWVRKEDLQARANPSPSSAHAAVQARNGVAIAHDRMMCMIAGKFPELRARLDPADQVARARVDFHGEGDPRWYYVDMKAKEGVFTGTLPKPLKEIGKVHYYIEVLDKGLAPTQTEEYTSDVVESGGLCADPKKVAVAVGSASVKVGVPGGAPGVPAGFSAAGVLGVGAATAGAAAATGAATAAGHTTAIVLGALGAGAVAGGVVAVTRDSSSLPTGTFVGTLSAFDEQGNYVGPGYNCHNAYAWNPLPVTITITDSGATGTISFAGMTISLVGGCGTGSQFAAPEKSSSGGAPVNLQVTVSGTTVAATSPAMPYLDSGGAFTLRGVRAGPTISGTFTHSLWTGAVDPSGRDNGPCLSGAGVTCITGPASGTWTATKQ